MQMRSPSSRCWPHDITLTRNAWTNDVDGGRILAGQTIVYDIPCSVQPGEATTEETSDPEGGLRRVTHIVPFNVIFPENPQLNVDDLISWLDSDGGNDGVTHLIRVKGYRNNAGLRSTFEIFGEERM